MRTRRSSNALASGDAFGVTGVIVSAVFANKKIMNAHNAAIELLTVLDSIVKIPFALIFIPLLLLLKYTANDFPIQDK